MSPKIENKTKLDQRSMNYRKTILEVLKRAGRGHIGSAFSIIEIVRVLYDEVLNVDPKNPFWDDRDRFILSKGHGCLGLYTILAEKGFFKEEALYHFCEATSFLGGHPDYLKVPGVEASTGSLGHGLSVGIGIAINGRMEKKDYKTVVLLGDGECQEGTIWEAAMSASKYKLDNLLVLVDYNKMQCYSSTYEVQDLEPFADKWRSFGFNVFETDGHDVQQLSKILNSAKPDNQKPNCIICHTLKGKGIGSIESNPSWHHKSRVPAEDIQELIEELESIK